MEIKGRSNRRKEITRKSFLVVSRYIMADDCPLTTVATTILAKEKFKSSKHPHKKSLG